MYARAREGSEVAANQPSRSGALVMTNATAVGAPPSTAPELSRGTELSAIASALTFVLQDFVSVPLKSFGEWVGYSFSRYVFDDFVN